MSKNTNGNAMLNQSLHALEDFGALQSRYQPLTLSKRALAVLSDAEPVLHTCEQLLGELAEHPDIKKVFDAVRKNPQLTGKMRVSEAKNILMDADNDFIALTLHKLSAWQKTMQRLGAGEGISMENNKEYIPGDVPVALALLSVNGVGAYLGVIQMALAELAKIDTKNAMHHQSNIAKIRRCSTLISDYDSASCLRGVIH
jgi:hypothetical protein